MMRGRRIAIVDEAARPVTVGAAIWLGLLVCVAYPLIVLTETIRETWCTWRQRR